MTTYEYRCSQDGVFEVQLPLGSAPPTIECPACNAQGRRVFSAPMIKSVPRGLMDALDREDKSRTDPDVVTSLPSTGVRKRTPVLPLTPTLRRLPRP